MPTYIETADAAAGTSTTYRLTSGQSAQGTLAAAGDHDWYAVDLVAGQTYTFALVGTGTNNVSDSYLYLRGSSGTLITSDNDSGPGSSSSITYTATASGTYYLDAGANNNVGTGQYTVSVTNGSRASFDFTQAGGAIDSNASWSSPGQSTTVTWGFRDTAATYTVSGSNISTFTRLSAAEMAAMQSIIGMWSDVSGLTFTQVNSGGYTDNATILVGNYQDATDGAGAFAYYPGSTAPTSASGDVWLNTNSVSTTSIPLGTYSYFAIMHEMGHAVGLSHPGDYNAAPGVSITYASNAQFTQDSQQYSVMSYFSGSNTGANLGGYPVSPMLWDIYELQQIYGANTTTRTGNTTYGYNSNAGANFNFSTGAKAFCIWDAGGTDTLDFSGYASTQTITLIAGDFSSTGGLTFNVSIAYGAVIENAIGGSGADTIIGNGANNTLSGLGGGDTLSGGRGDDTLIGGSGSNALNGGGGRDISSYAVASSATTITRNADGSVTISGSGFTDTLTGVEVAHFTDRDVALRTVAGNDFIGDGQSSVLFRNNATGDTGYFQIGTNGALQGWRSIGGSSSAYSVAGQGDFNGDGTADILYRNTATGDTGYYQMLDGALQGWHSIGGSSTAYAVSGVGDFNGDGTSDILFRNTATGDTGFFQMSNGALQSWRPVGGTSPAYAVAGIGDFTGDSTSDILFRNNGTGDWGFYQMSNGTLQSWRSLGGSSTAYAVAGIGDFNGDGTSDVLYRNNTTGDMGYYQMSNGLSQGWHSLGGSSSAYSLVGTGDYNGNGVSDLLFRNTATGDTGYYSVSNSGTISNWVALGSSSTSYTVVAG